MLCMPGVGKLRSAMLESIGPLLVNVNISCGIYTGATGMRQKKHTPFESRLYVYIVSYRVNMEQSMQH